MLSNHSPSRATGAWPALVLATALGPGLPAVTESAVAAERGIEASIARGGRLYDNWYKEIRRAPPAALHPAYPDATRYADAPAGTWRCKACHGWDYRGRDGAYATGAHFTGIVGIRGMAGASSEKIIAVLKDDTHALAKLDLLDDRDFADLANFVSKGQIDTREFIDLATGKAKGDATRRQAYYQTICANCHGRDGLAIRSIPPLGQIARDNPWEALHNMLNGHPDEQMPALRLFGTQVLVDILAYIQTFPTDETLASMVRGGRLYDNWYQEIRAAAPTRSHPAYPSSGRYAKAPKANWRCKECHGWDYQGRDGAYSEGRHFTGITGIRGMAGAEPRKIVAVLQNDTHRYRGELSYRASMSERDFQDLATFVSKGQVDMEQFIDRATKKAKGDDRRREAYYRTICASCHGIDGKQVSTLRPLGEVARANPWRALHTILNGHPEVQMTPLRVLDDPSVVSDILAYIQTLSPEE